MQALACNAMSDKTAGLRASHLLLTDFSSVIRNLNPFKSLITGETSYQNSTSLLIGLALRDCCPSLPVFIFNFDGVSVFVFFFSIWRPPTLPHRLQCSTIGRPGLNHRVRDGNGCYPWTHRHQKILGFRRGYFLSLIPEQ